MKIIVDRTRCSGLGLCESVAPDVFEVSDGGEVVLKTAEVPEDQLAEVEDAVAGCPTEALRIER